MSDLANPYAAFADTPEWAVIDRAVSELAENHDLEETTDHTHIVGYLCKALAEKLLPAAMKPRRSTEDLQAILEAAQAEVRQANPTGRNLLAELIAERRAEAARE